MRLKSLALVIPALLLAAACAPTDCDGGVVTPHHHTTVTHHHVVTHRHVVARRSRSLSKRR